MKIEVSILMPALNEAKNLNVLLPELKTILNSIFKNYEIIIVDGGSKDESAEVAKANGCVFTKQRFPGFGGALKTGFCQAKGEYVITMDADLSHGPEFIERIWSKKDMADIIVASRYISSSSVEMPMVRYILSRILNILFTFGLSLPVKDISSNFRLYRRDILEGIRISSSNYDVLEEILLKLLAEGYTIYEVPFVYRPRPYGKSHVKLFKFAISYLKTFFSMWQLRNSIYFADYDVRAFYSRIFFQRWWQRRRYKIIMEYLEEKASILDIGCGTSKIIIDLPISVGVDIDLGKLRYLRKTNARLVNADGRKLPFKNSCFSTVICSELIEHIKGKEIFKEFNRVLKKGGLLILGTPDYGRIYWPLIEKLYRFFHRGGYADKHITPYTSKELFAFLDKNDFEILQFDYIFKSELITKARKRGGKGEEQRKRG